MALDRADIGELIARIYDRLDGQFGEHRLEILDAVLLVEVADLDDTEALDDGTEREVPATLVLLECTSDRVTVQSGIVEFARRTLIGGGEPE